MPPAPAGSRPAEKCSVASAQLVASAATRPVTRSAIVVRPCPGWPGTRLRPTQALNAIATGNRNAGQPNNRYSALASQAPSGPIRLLTCPGSPV